MNNPGESFDEVEEVFKREIEMALSTTFAKTLQELLPGYLPLRNPMEFSSEEIKLYRLAYNIIAEMIEEEVVDVVFVTVKDTIDDVGVGEMAERQSERRYKLSPDGGKKYKITDRVPDTSIELVTTA